MRENLIRKLICCIAILSIALGVQAKVRLPRLINDGMVLQREAPLKIWGWASPNERVKLSFLDKAYNTKADKNGNWSIEILPCNAGGPYSMHINDLEVKDILIGDVWLCSGQSNMELPIRRVLDLYKDEVKSVTNSHIRYFRVPLKYNFQKEDTDYQAGEWMQVTPQNILDFSAVAYFFAKDLFDKYGVPVGIINTAVGGSPAEAWVSADVLKNYPHYLKVANTCANQSYVDSIISLEAQKNKQWNTELSQKDKGINLWIKKDFNDSDWNTISLPGYWADKGLGQVNGSLWFRKEIDVPASMVGQEGTLRLGCIVDADSAFINGVFVGTISYQYPPRIYNIPSGLLKEGKNNITVRVISTSSFIESLHDMGKDTITTKVISLGGFVEEKPYKIIVGTNEIDLTGDWKYKIGAQMPPATPQTFFHYKPMALYNGMIAPVKHYALTGFLWYQGESNTNRAGEYRSLFIDLINDWRAKWNNSELPFIYAQLPNFMKEKKQPSESGWAELREAQRLALRVPNTGMAVTIDVGEWNDVHPLNKKTVGERLALEARRMTYGENNIVSTGPIYESMEVDGNSIILTFSSVGAGIYTNLYLKGFSIAGSDKSYVWANAVVLSRNKIKVWSNSVLNPVSVRYAWADNPVGSNLKNKEGLPASPFTTELE